MKFSYGFSPTKLNCDVTGDEIKEGDLFSKISFNTLNNNIELEFYDYGKSIRSRDYDISLSIRGLKELTNKIKNLKCRRFNKINFKNFFIVDNHSGFSIFIDNIRFNLNNKFILNLDDCIKFLDNLEYKKINKIVSLRKTIKEDSLIKKDKKKSNTEINDKVLSLNSISQMSNPLIVEKEDISEFIKELKKCVDQETKSKEYHIYYEFSEMEKENNCMYCGLCRDLIRISNNSYSSSSIHLCSDCCRDLINNIYNYSQKMKFNIIFGNI